MINVLFGYSDEYEFHGPLETILSFVDIPSLEKEMKKVCKNFYLASKCSYLGRDFDYKIATKKLHFSEKVDKSFESFLLRVYEYGCIDADNNLFGLCADQGLANMIKVLLKDERIDPSFEYNQAIRFACNRGHVEVVKLLINDIRVDPSDKDNLPFIFACENGHKEIVEILIKDKRVNPADLKNEAIRLVTKKEVRNKEILEILISDIRVDAGFDGNFLLKEQISMKPQNADIEFVKLLFSNPFVQCNVHLIEYFRKACINDHFEIVKLMIPILKEHSDSISLNRLFNSLIELLNHNDDIIQLLKKQ